MINVTSILENANKKEKSYRSRVTIDGDTSEIVCEIKALIHSFLDDPQLEAMYLSISTEIVQIRVKDLESELEDLKND